MLSVIKIERISAVNFYDLSPKFNTEIHNHKEWEIIYVDSGEVSCETEFKTLNIKAGDVIFHRPNTSHKTVCNGKKSATMFNVLFYCSSPSIELFKDSSFHMPQSAIGTLRELMDESARTYKISEHPMVLRKDAPIGGEQMTKILLEKLLLILIREKESYGIKSFQSSSTSDTECGLVEEICEHMKNHIYGNLSLDDLTERFHFGKSFLCEQFKKNTGKSPINYYLDLKLSEAKRLLREGDMTITEIAENLGFESPEYFSRYFKKRVGHSPRDFKKMLINDATLRKKN